MDIGNFGLTVARRPDHPGGVTMTLSSPEIGEVLTLNLDAARSLQVGLWWMNAIAANAPWLTVTDPDTDLAT